MKKNKPTYVDWILRAQDDEKSAEVLLKEGGVPNTICFLSQQMVEKILKGFLIYKNKGFPKIHQLDSLATKITKEIDSDFQKIEKDAEYLTGFYTTTRYPGDYPQFSMEEARIAFEKASKIKNFVMDKIYSQK